jgi:hypothetical protein
MAHDPSRTAQVQTRASGCGETRVGHVCHDGSLSPLYTCKHPAAATATAAPGHATPRACCTCDAVQLQGLCRVVAHGSLRANSRRVRALARADGPPSRMRARPSPSHQRLPTSDSSAVRSKPPPPPSNSPASAGATPSPLRALPSRPAPPNSDISDALSSSSGPPATPSCRRSRAASRRAALRARPAYAASVFGSSDTPKKPRTMRPEPARNMASVACER